MTTFADKTLKNQLSGFSGISLIGNLSMVVVDQMAVSEMSLCYGRVRDKACLSKGSPWWKNSHLVCEVVLDKKKKKIT